MNPYHDPDLDIDFYAYYPQEDDDEADGSGEENNSAHEDKASDKADGE